MKLLLALIAIPLIEITLFIQIGEKIGIATTLIIIILSAIVGINLIRKQSFSILQKMRAHQANKTQLPEDLFSDFCQFMGAILLIIPGFFTDFIGILFFIPACQNFLFQNSSNNPSRRKQSKQKKKTIIDVEYIEVEEIDKDKKPDA